MSALTLTLRQAPPASIDMTPLSPDKLHNMTLSQIAKLPLLMGNRYFPVDELFALSGTGAAELTIIDSHPHLEAIGAGMRHGSIRVSGNAGVYLGREMQGGSVHVDGNTGHYTAAGMTAGTIRIDGNTGDFLGGAVSGEKRGMNGGTVIINGNSGRRAGDRLRRGLIVITGDSGSHCASQMIAGTLVVLGQTGSQTGIAMKRGTVLLARPPAAITGTFNPNGCHELGFLPLLLAHLKTLSVPLTTARPKVRRFVGDRACNGLGEILLLNDP